ncbi:cysteine-rich receptor-like protein kinase 8 [Tanacetum coccineum]
MINPLPNVENACFMIQQEESQRMLFDAAPSMESTALYNKGGVKDKCSICGFKWHPPEKYWEKVGYPPWHPKSNGSQANRQVKTGQGQIRNQFVPRTVAHVESGNISFTPQQFEKLLKSVQQMGMFNAVDEEIDHQFAAGLDNKEGERIGLGHVSDSKLKHIKELPLSVPKECLEKCLSCLMAKFTKLPYALSDSHDVNIFDLIHIDIWGPYKVPTNGKFRYFLTIVDDCSRGTWVYLLEQKSYSKH